jgi:hypothetical protein
MKPSLLPTLGLLATLCLSAAAQTTARQSFPPLTSTSVIERGANHRTWEIEYFTEDELGFPVNFKRQYVEIASGLHYPDNGEWKESRAEFRIAADGAVVADQGQHKVRIAPNLRRAGAVTLTAPDGSVFRSHVVGLNYYDVATGQNVLLGEIKDCSGELVAPNQVLFRDAFTGVKADIRYTYTRDGFEQDIILREQPAAPSVIGFGDASTRLEVLTEFLDTPRRGNDTRTLATGVTDETLEAGTMRIGAGRAFNMGTEDSLPRVPVGKEWNRTEGREFLIESVPYGTMENHLRALPPQSASLPATPGIIRRASKERQPPRLQLAGGRARPVLLASTSRVEPGFVIDYSAVVTTTNMVFAGNTTYLVSGAVNLSGTTVIEGGAVIKYDTATNATLNILGALDCQTEAYRPAVFTSRHDNSIGEVISGSSGNPSILNLTMLQAGDQTNTLDFAHLRLLYAARALNITENSTSNTLRTVRHVQFARVGTAIATEQNLNLRLRNVLVYAATNCFSLDAPATISGEHLTVSQVANLRSGNTNLTLALTNSLLVAVTNTAAYSAVETSVASGTSGVFEVSGAGGHYLPSGSTNRNSGTTNIEPLLLADIRTLTTHAPQVYSNQLVSADLQLQVHVARDTDQPDRGYHYAPLDHVFGQVTVSNALVTCLPGVAIGTFDYQTSGHGLSLRAGGRVVAEGIPQAPVILTRYNTVQEQANTNWSSVSYWGYVNATTSDTPLPEARFRHVRWTCMSRDRNFIHGRYNEAWFHFTDCEFKSGQIDTWSTSLAFTNCLFQRANLGLNGYVHSSPINLNLFNSLFWQSTLGLYRNSGVVSTWTVKDNLFYKSSEMELVSYGSGTNIIQYNAYITNYPTLLTEATDVILQDVAFETGPLGKFYYPTNTALINAGSLTNAGLRGLYHYTTTTNQVKDAATRLDIGYHYVATDSSGVPLDSDGDGTPDYIEDANGNGSVNSGETDPASSTDVGLKVLITRPRNGSQLP